MDDEEFWNGNDASSSSLPQQPDTLALLTSPPPAHFDSSVKTPVEHESLTAETSEQPRSISPVKPLGSVAPMLIPQSNRSASSALGKAAPADPHTTRADVESQLLSSSSASSMNDTVSDLAGHAQLQGQSSLPPAPSTPTIQTTGAFFNNMFNAATSSLQFNRNKVSADTTVDMDNTVLVDSPGGIAESGITEDEKILASPGMMSYRRKGRAKGRRNTSVSSVDLPESPLAEAEKPYSEDTFDASLYVDEKFKDTIYRYAAETRNETFHRVFKSIPANERLLDDFSCALSREILLQGRVYISEHNVCFNSNLLGWVTTLVIPFADINGFEKTATAGLFPNGIAVSSKDGLKSFASFISRDNVYQFITTVWKSSGDQTNSPSSSQGSHVPLDGPLVLTKELDIGSDDIFGAAIMSIDGDSPMKRKQSVASSSSGEYDEDSDDEELDEEDESSDSGGSSWTEMKTSNQSVHNLKDSSKYTYNGTHAHGVTKCPYDPEDNKEKILIRENLKCPPGLLHEILFGKDPDLILNFLASQDSREVSEFTEYTPNDDGNRERSYDYIKALNFSMGPKQTKCEVKETIEHLDYNGYINVVNTTQTPDVPSGKSFCVKTRYLMSWGSGNTTDLVISYWIHWTASSWIKGVIEKSTESGQTAAALDLIKMIEKTIDKNVEEKIETVEVTSSTEELIEKATEIQAVQESSTARYPASTAGTTNWASSFTPFNCVVIVLLSVVAVLQYWILQRLSTLPGAASTLASLSIVNEIERYTGDLLFRGQQVVIWNWIDERAGKLDMSRFDKAKVIQQEIDTLLEKWSSGQLDTAEGRLMVKQFERSVNEYAQVSEKDEKKKQKAEELRKAIQALL